MQYLVSLPTREVLIEVAINDTTAYPKHNKASKARMRMFFIKRLLILRLTLSIADGGEKEFLPPGDRCRVLI